tara:strand:- start:360 stop:872 length:513 start_codon:yes stop_codon:yes gene_type:complete
MNELYEDNKIESCDYKHINNNIKLNKMIICRNNPFDQKKYQIDEKLTDKIQTEISKECPICFEFIKKSDPIITYQCLHKFHFNCMQEWIDKGNPSHCILCKCSKFIISYPSSTKKKLNISQNTDVPDENFNNILPNTNQDNNLQNNQMQNRHNIDTNQRFSNYCDNCIIC